MARSSRAIIGAAAVAVGIAGTSSTAFAQNQVANNSAAVPAKSSKNLLAASPDDGQVIGCLIEPRVTSQVAASAPGVLTDVKVERGDRVTKGQVLAILDRDVEVALLDAARERSKTQAAINAARATRNMAYHKLNRIRKLNALSYGAKLELELATGELSLAESRLQQARDEHKAAANDHTVAQHQLARRQVISPIDGVVADRLLNPGERADGRAIVRIVQLDTLRVEVILPIARFGKISAGMHGEVTPELDGAAAVNATVEQVDPFIDAASGTFRARLAMNNADLSVPAGIRCNVKFAADGEQPGNS